jgi:hypothetical protein
MGEGSVFGSDIRLEFDFVVDIVLDEVHLFFRTLIIVTCDGRSLFLGFTLFARNFDLLLGGAGDVMIFKLAWAGMHDHINAPQNSIHC